MTSKKAGILARALLLALIALCCAACTRARPEPRSPGLTPTPASQPPAPAAVRSARDAVIAALGNLSGQQGPPQGLTWQEKRVTPPGVTGSETYEYTSGDWLLRIQYASPIAAGTAYHVVVLHAQGDFAWEGKVDAAGQVSAAEAGPTTDAVAARDRALAFLRIAQPDRAPPEGVPWAEERVTPPGLVGAETYRFKSGDWEIQVEYPVVAAANVEYHVQVLNAPAQFYWSGIVDAQGHVTAADQAADSIAAVRDAVLAFLRAQYPEQAPEGALTWSQVKTTPAGATDKDSWELSAGEWLILITRPMSDESAPYHVALGRTGGGFEWAGDVTPAGAVTQTQVVLPPGTAADAVEGWSGVIVRNPAGSQFDDAFERDNGARYGLAGADEEMDKRLQAFGLVRARVQVWGRVEYNVPDVEGRQIVVERIELLEAGAVPGGATTGEKMPVEGWTGTLLKLPPGNQFGELFVRDTDGTRYSLGSENSAISKQIADALWATPAVRLWGTLVPGVPTASGGASPATGGGYIDVRRIEPQPELAGRSRNMAAWATARAASTLAADDAGSYDAALVADGRLDTCWSEGLTGEGLGEWIELRFDKPVQVRSLIFANGFQKSDKLYAYNQRIHAATLTFSGGETLDVELLDTKEKQPIPLAAPITCTSLRLTIRSVYAGDRFQDACLSEIEVWGAPAQ